MRKSLLVFLTILFVAPMLTGCCPCWYGSGGRGYGYERGYNGQRDGSPDYREHRWSARRLTSPSPPAWSPGRLGVGTLFFDPGSPWGNGPIESCNREGSSAKIRMGRSRGGGLRYPV